MTDSDSSPQGLIAAGYRPEQFIYVCGLCRGAGQDERYKSGLCPACNGSGKGEY